MLGRISAMHCARYCLMLLLIYVTYTIAIVEVVA
jgi:hypothetical protein